jgi:hypothetical protein
MEAIVSKKPVTHKPDARQIAAIVTNRLAAPPKQLESTFTSTITRHVAQIVEANPDKSNAGRYYGEALVWATLERVAKNKREALWETMQKEGLITEIPPDPGTYEVGMSPHFVASVTVSEKVRRFSADKLCELLTASKYKVPAPIVKEFVEKAKVPTTSTVTKRVIERNV